MTKEEKLEKHLNYILTSCIPSMIQEAACLSRNDRTRKLLHMILIVAEECRQGLYDKTASSYEDEEFNE